MVGCVCGRLRHTRYPLFDECILRFMICRYCRRGRLLTFTFHEEISISSNSTEVNCACCYCTVTAKKWLCGWSFKKRNYVKLTAKYLNWSQRLQVGYLVEMFLGKITISFAIVFDWKQRNFSKNWCTSRSQRWEFRISSIFTSIYVLCHLVSIFVLPCGIRGTIESIRKTGWLFSYRRNARDDVNKEFMEKKLNWKMESFDRIQVSSIEQPETDDRAVRVTAVMTSIYRDV